MFTDITSQCIGFLVRTSPGYTVHVTTSNAKHYSHTGLNRSTHTYVPFVDKGVWVSLYTELLTGGWGAVGRWVWPGRAGS